MRTTEKILNDWENPNYKTYRLIYDTKENLNSINNLERIILFFIKENGPWSLDGLKGIFSNYGDEKVRKAITNLETDGIIRNDLNNRYYIIHKTKK